MTSRERVLAAINHKKPDITPFSLGFSVNLPAKKALAEYLGKDLVYVENMLLSCSDIRWVAPKYIGPSNRFTTRENGTLVDEWGVERRLFSYGEGEYEEISRYVLADITKVEQLDKYVFPSAEWFDYSTIMQQIREIKKTGDFAVITGTANIFESAWYMRGFEQIFIDMIETPEFVMALMRRVTDFYIAYFSKILEAASDENGCNIDIIFTADDIGQQTGLITSPEIWREMIKPFHKEMNVVFHKYKVKIMYHSDGAVSDVLEELVDMGIDILEALQFDAKNMDPADMKRRVGDKIAFHGGISVQSTLPFGTPEDVTREVAERIRILGENGGYIIAPSHAVQAGTPPENIIAFLKAAGRI